MLQYYPSFNHIFDDLKGLSGNRTGILNQSQAPVCNHPHDVYLKSVTGQMPDYHKQFIGELVRSVIILLDMAVTMKRL